ncbi:MAG TPA: FKBP-type peptidyl-prolyl cis-trans isomerase [Hyphomonadaceae bacterium]|jgi:FKBP-type peptidyl-prolyl cis-trans isomerase|nr:FKBP-type peptidyl-prolyl cis-trans isomerase [Hyphomonadaceae bacterium]HPN06186.1 FKBP-type peptidyl-prolyl cis-trans isomerase [Hyphomonadaceae bacterium]
MRTLITAVSVLALAACGEATTPATPAPTAETPAATPAPAAGVKAADAAAWAKYVPWKHDLPEVVKTGSGVEYVVLASGPADGVPPKPNEQAEVFYEGRLDAGGPAFDSAFERGESATFPVAAVVDGFSEVLKLMKPGDRWLAYLPYQLAYGAGGKGPIPPAADLIFEIELVSVKP